MPRDFLPAIYPNTAAMPSEGEQKNDVMLYNCLPQPRDNGTWGAFPRAEMTDQEAFTPSASADRGRGVTAFQNRRVLYLDQDTYYYSGGNQDLTATTGNGYAGNTGFNEEYIATFPRHAVSGSENLVIVNAGHTSKHANAKHGNVWYVADGNTAPSSISDADLPCNNGVSIVRGGASLDGYFFVGDIDGKIYNSNLNDITAWTATDFITAERAPDIGVYVGKHHDNIVYIGTESIEFFYNAGNPDGSPLARRQDVSYRIGCAVPNTISERGDVIRFVGTTSKGETGIYEIRGFQVNKISDTLIDEFIRNKVEINSLLFSLTSATIDTLHDDVYGVDVLINGRFGYLFTCQAEGSFFYDDEAGVWSALATSGTETYPGNISSWTSCLPIVAYNQYSAPDSSSSLACMQLTNGRLIHFGAGDDDDPNDITLGEYDRYVNFGRWDGGTNRKKKVTSVRIICDTLGKTSRENTAGQLQWTKYGLQDVTAAKAPPAGAGYDSSRSVNLNTRVVPVGRIGTGREFRFLLNITTGHGAHTAIKGLEIDYEVVE